MRLSSLRIALASACLWSAACFAPTFADGEVACGASGCPDDMVCRADGLCYHDGDDGDGGDGTSARGNAVLAVGNYGAANRLYAYCDGFLLPVWTSDTADTTTSVAWGDLDRDGDPEVVFGNYDQAIRAYDVAGDTRPVWTSDLVRRTRGLDLADIDFDGDVDLATGNEGQILRMFKWIFSRDEFEERWGSEFEVGATSVAWGLDDPFDDDYNLAVGISNGQTEIYRVDRDERLSSRWSAPEIDDTRAVAWGDVDGDGHLDLATGNWGARNRVYRRVDRGEYVLWWTSDSADEQTTSLAWADFDGDGDDDLAIGNYGGQNVVYRNVGGQLEVAWSSPDTDDTRSVAWGDLDGDGDLDLLVGNDGAANRAYRNDGGAWELVWSSQELDATHAVAWRQWQPSGDDLSMCAAAAAR